MNRAGGPKRAARERTIASVLLSRSLHGLELVHDLAQVVAGRVLHRRELLVGLELLEPQGLPDRQKVPVVDVCRRRRSNGSAHTEQGLVLLSDGSLERITLDVD